MLCNRVKPHTTFAGPMESGLAKMLVIGQGKHEGATTAHRAAIEHAFTAMLAAATPVNIKPLLPSLRTIVSHCVRPAAPPVPFKST